MTEAEWLACTDPNNILYRANWRDRRGSRLRRPGPESCHPAVSSERKFRLYACACFRLYFPHLRYEADRRILDVAERFADGVATEIELSDAAKRCGATAVTLARRPAIEVARHIVLGSARADHPAGLPVLLPDPLRCQLLRCIFGNPFRPVTADPRWLTSTVVALARSVYADRAFDRLPILADALEEAGCDNPDVLTHCRGDGPHVRGCWVVDLILDKE